MYIIGIEWIDTETMACKYLEREITSKRKQNKTKLCIKLNLIFGFNTLALASVLILVLSNTLCSLI